MLVNDEKTTLYHIDFSFDKLKLGGSAFAQSLGKVGDEVPCVQDAEYFRDAFLAVQELINKGLVLCRTRYFGRRSYHYFARNVLRQCRGRMEIDLDKMKEQDLVKILFAENPGIVIQVSNKHKERSQEDTGRCRCRLYQKSVSRPDERHIPVSKDGATLPLRCGLHARCLVLFIVSAGPQNSP